MKNVVANTAYETRALTNPVPRILGECLSISDPLLNLCQSPKEIVAISFTDPAPWPYLHPIAGQFELQQWLESLSHCARLGLVRDEMTKMALETLAFGTLVLFYGFLEVVHFISSFPDVYKRQPWLCSYRRCEFSLSNEDTQAMRKQMGLCFQHDSDN